MLQWTDRVEDGGVAGGCCVGAVDRLTGCAWRREAAAFDVDARPGRVEVVQQAVHAGAAVEPGAVDEAADDETPRTGWAAARLA